MQIILKIWKNFKYIPIIFWTSDYSVKFWPILSLNINTIIFYFGPSGLYIYCRKGKLPEKWHFLLFFLIVVQGQLSPFSPHHTHCLPPLNPLPLALSMCPSYMFLDAPPHYPLLSPFPLFSGYSHIVLYFNISGCILLACLFCWLGSTYRWDHKVFLFHCLACFT